MGDKKIFVIAKIFDKQGCIAYRCKTMNEARCLPGTLEALRAEGVQIVILDSGCMFLSERVATSLSWIW